MRPQSDPCSARNAIPCSHMRALPHRDVAAAVGMVRASRATQAVRLAFEFLVLTAARSAEVRLATWDEIDTCRAASGPSRLLA